MTFYIPFAKENKSYIKNSAKFLGSGSP